MEELACEDFDLIDVKYLPVFIPVTLQIGYGTDHVFRRGSNGHLAWADVLAQNDITVRHHGILHLL